MLSLLLFLVLSLPVLRAQGFYDFTVNAIDGKAFPLSSLKGKKVMVVNVASRCGLTPQYEQLQQLYDTYGADNFTIIAFPANNFLEQEPGTNEEIMEFCRINYGVTFPVMEKISVAGEDIHPLYRWLTTDGGRTAEPVPVDWNFHKYLISAEGEVEHSVPARTSPLDETIIEWITE